jgi:hypothetical protein
MIRRVLDLPPTTIPVKPVAEIASYGSTTVWVDPKLGVVVRRGGKASSLKVEAKGLEDLDLGPAADGTPTAVYTRCARGCDVYAFSLRPGAGTKEVRVPGAAKPGVSEHMPTLWKGTVAFLRDGALYTTKLTGANTPKLLMKNGGFDDVELGPREIAVTGEYDGDEGNGQTEVDLVPLSKPRGDWYMVDEQGIGEGSAAGFGGVTAAPDGTFTWQRAFRNGCEYPKRVARRGSLKHYAKTVDKATAPLAVRYAAPVVPGTPMSEDCEDG